MLNSRKIVNFFILTFSICLSVIILSLLIPISIEPRKQIRFIRLFMKDWLIWRKKLFSRFNNNSNIDLYNNNSGNNNIINSSWHTIGFLFYESIDMINNNSKTIAIGFLVFVFLQNYFIQYNYVMDDIYSLIDFSKFNRYISSFFYDSDISMPALEMEGEDEDNGEDENKEESEIVKMRRIRKKKVIDGQDIRSNIDMDNNNNDDDDYSSGGLHMYDNIHNPDSINGRGAKDNGDGDDNDNDNGNDSSHNYSHCQWYSSNSSSNKISIHDIEEEKEQKELPGDLLVYDKIVGVVPWEVLQRWRVLAQEKERESEEMERSNKSSQKPNKKCLPPVRFSVST